MKKGFSSTEFWLTIVGVTASTYLGVKGVDATVIVTVAGLIGVYTGGRSLVKAKNGGA